MFTDIERVAIIMLEVFSNMLIKISVYYKFFYSFNAIYRLIKFVKNY